MVRANIALNDESNSVLNFVKATKEFKDKSEVVNFIIMEYAEKILNHEEFKDEFIKSVLKNRQSKPSEYVDVSDEAKMKELLGL